MTVQEANQKVEDLERIHKNLKKVGDFVRSNDAGIKSIVSTIEEGANTDTYLSKLMLDASEVIMSEIIHMKNCINSTTVDIH